MTSVPYQRPNPDSRNVSLRHRNPLGLHRYVNTYFSKLVKTKSGICSIVWTKQNVSIFNNKSLKQVNTASSKVWASNNKHKEKHVLPFIIKPSVKAIILCLDHALSYFHPNKSAQDIGSSALQRSGGKEGKTTT